MTNKQVLITGANDFVGLHLTKTLVRKGDSVHALVQNESEQTHLWSAIPEDIRVEVQITQGSIRDTKLVHRLIQGKDQVFHLASDLSGPSQELIETNVAGTLNILHAALKHSCTVIHTSCGSVYGQPLYSPVDEKHPLQNQSPYSSSKIAADMLVTSFYDSFQLPTVILRPFQVLESNLPEKNLFLQLYHMAVGQDRPTRFNWKPQILDYLHISDLIQAYLKLDGIALKGQVYNIAQGEAPDLAHILGLINQHLTPGNMLNQGVYQDISLSHADIGKAKQELGFKPMESLETRLKESLTTF